MQAPTPSWGRHPQRVAPLHRFRLVARLFPRPRHSSHHHVVQLRRGGAARRGRSPAPREMSAPLLQVENLGIEFGPADAPLRAVDGISFHVTEGETLAVVGESGSGKSVTALALTRLLPAPPACRVNRPDRIRGPRPAHLAGAGVARRARQGASPMFFQEPSSSLNPVFTIGFQIREAIELHRPEVRDVPRRNHRGAGPGSASATRPADWTTIRTSSAAACSNA